MKYYDIKTLRPDQVQEFEQLVRLLADVFEIEDFTLPTQAHLKWVLAQPFLKAVAAYVGKEMVGGLTGYVLPQYYSEKPQFYLYDLAVLPTWQRKGVGKALVQHLLEDCSIAGFEQLYVQADAEDKHAIDFYKATGGQDMAVWHFTYPMQPKG